MRKSVLAGVLQTPKWEKALLQKRCKAQKLLRSVCGSPASAPRNFLAFAGVPQALALIQYEEWECSLSAVHAKKQALASLPTL